MFFDKKILLCMVALSGFESLQALRGGVASEKKVSQWGKPALVGSWEADNVPQLTFYNPTEQKVLMTWEVVTADNKPSVLESGSIIVPHKGKKSTYKKVNFPKISSSLKNGFVGQFPSCDITISVARLQKYDSSGNNWKPAYVPVVPKSGDIGLFEMGKLSL